MSISGAMSSAVTGLKAQSEALAIISDNIVNATTVGYKASTTSFSTLITSRYNGNAYASGGVTAQASRNIAQQGLITDSASTTHLAVDGNGMFVVTYGANGDELMFTRNGEFSVDAEGMLKHGSYYLQGWPTDSEGNIIGGSTNSIALLEPVDVNRISGYAAATTTEDVKANLPAEAEVGDTFESLMTVYDSLGLTHDINMTWTKTATNTWTLALADPTLTSDSTVTSGTVAGGPFTITFTDGKVATVVPSPATVTVSGWVSGASDSTITLDLGDPGSNNRLSQYALNDTTPVLDVTEIKADGFPYGFYSGVYVSEDGTVVAKYDNGYQTPIYKIPLANFANVNALVPGSDGIYTQSMEAGSLTLKVAGQGTAGTIVGNALEASTVDTANELTQLIVAQHAYSAASQVITTGRDMFDTLIGAVR